MPDPFLNAPINVFPHHPPPPPSGLSGALLGALTQNFCPSQIPATSPCCNWGQLGIWHTLFAPLWRIWHQGMSTWIPTIAPYNPEGGGWWGNSYIDRCITRVRISPNQKVSLAWPNRLFFFWYGGGEKFLHPHIKRKISRQYGHARLPESIVIS